MIEGDFARAMRVKHELFKFGARRKPVLAELGNEKRLGVRRDRQACRGNLGIDQLRDVLGGIGIALDRRGVSFAFAKRPQGRVLLQRAGFDDDRAIAWGRPENRLERGNKCLALRLDRNRPPAAEQRNGIGLVGEARRIIGKLVAADPDKLKRVLRIVDGVRNNFPRPLGDKPGVGSKHKVQINMRRRAGEKSLGFVALDRDHGRLPVS